MTRQARSEYGLQVVPIRSFRESVRAVFVSVFAWGFLDSTPEGPRSRVQIVAVGGGNLLAEWKCYTAEATDLVNKIERDLDEKEADVFASEWGLISQ
jgi:hypothetical protein